jgi:hypothetical protein
MSGTPFEAGSKLKDKYVAQYVDVARGFLADGEEIRGFFWAAATGPVMNAVMITNARLVGISNAHLSDSAKAFRASLTLTEILTAEVAHSRMGLPVLRITTGDGDTRNYCRVRNEDAAALERHIKAMAGTSNSATDALAKAAEHASAHEDALHAMVIGRVGGKVLDEIRKSCGPGETPEFIVGEGQAGGLVAFADRCMIIKKGALTGFMAGSVGGGRVATFMYSEITGIEYNSGWINGVLEILTPSYQGSSNKDFWRGTKKGRNADSNDPWTLSNTLPLTKPTYEKARTKIDHMRQMVAIAKRPIVHAPATEAFATDLSTELGKLAELHKSAVLDDEEFRQAKQALITKRSGNA